MNRENEKRAYIRENCLYEAEIIVDEVGEEVIVTDLSASGMKFIAEVGSRKYSPGDLAVFHLEVHEFAAEVTIKAQIKICRVEVDSKGEATCGAAFVNLTLEQGIRLDEVIMYKKRKSDGFYHEIDKHDE